MPRRGVAGRKVLTNEVRQEIRKGVRGTKLVCCGFLIIAESVGPTL